MVLAPPVPFTPSVEQIQPDEDATIEELDEAFGVVLDHTLSEYGRAVRSVHAKANGILEGSLVVDANLAPELAQGAFAKPGSHRAYVRFSTNAGDLLPDTISLPRGLALKVLDVDGERLEGAEGTTQDFLFVNGPVFANHTAAGFLKNLKLLAQMSAKMEGLKVGISAAMRGVGAALRTVGVTVPAVNNMGGAPNVEPLGETYYSTTPFRYGDYMAKFSLAPVGRVAALAGTVVEPGDERDAIRLDVQREMRAGDATYEFRVQLCRDLERQPIEDPTVRWDEEFAPFQRVATLTFPAQDSWSDAHVREVDDGMRFAVWTGLAAHRPLGNVNRARREPYKRSADFRARTNGCPIQEPR